MFCVLAVSQEARVGCQEDESLVSLRIVVTVIEINRYRGREAEEAGGCFVTGVARWLLSVSKTFPDRIKTHVPLICLIVKHITCHDINQRPL